MELGDCVEAVLVMGRVAEPAAAILVVFHIWNSAASPHGVSVPLVPPSSTASVPLAPPAGIAAPAHPTAPSSASAAFSPPSEGNRGAPPPHRFHIGRPPCGKERMVGEVKKGGGYSHSAGSTSAGLRSAGRSPPHSVAPGRQGISRGPCGSRPRSGSCMRRSTARTRHPPCALRCALINRSAPRRIRRQGVFMKGLTGASPLSGFS